jgi:hypothetical protein
MLSSLRLVELKSFHDQTLSLAPLTVLAGANASAKSNFFDAIRFLQGIGLDMPLTEILLGRWEGGREVWPGLRGGVAEVAYAGTGAASSCAPPGRCHVNPRVLVIHPSTRL